MANEYIPGVCNINTAEIASRRKAGYVGLALTLFFAAALFGLDLPKATRLILFIPVFITAIGFLQAHNKFCVGYGAAGMQNAADGSDAAMSVEDSSAVLADKSRARTMNLQAAGIAITVTVIVALLP